MRRRRNALMMATVASCMSGIGVREARCWVTHPPGLQQGTLMRTASRILGSGRLYMDNTVARSARFCASGKKTGRKSPVLALDGTNRSPSGKANRKMSDDVLNSGPPRGTRDFYPSDMRMRSWLFEHWKVVASQFGFEEYDAPILESEDLYIRKSGEEVSEQLYSFKDKGGRRVALRPEMTPSLARMVMARRNGLTLPVKWFSIPQCWRYERTTRGRRREHFQWNMDIWGDEGPEAEAELLAAIVAFFRRVGLSEAEVGIRINSRGVLSELLTGMGIPEQKHAAICILIDKLPKIPVDDLQSEAEDLNLGEEILKKLTDVVRNASLSSLEEQLGNSSPALKQLKRLLKLAEEYGYNDWLVFDPSVVRGLAYYTGMVFEAFDKAGSLRAICGGGRYDHLLESFGGESLPACGFGFGDAVIVELLRENDLLPKTDRTSIDALVVPLGEGERQRTIAINASCMLREAGKRVDLILQPKKLKWIFKHADRRGADILCLVGPDEAERGTVSVKWLSSGEQREVALENIGSFQGNKE